MSVKQIKIKKKPAYDLKTGAIIRHICGHITVHKNVDRDNIKAIKTREKKPCSRCKQVYEIKGLIETGTYRAIEVLYTDYKMYNEYIKNLAKKTKRKIPHYEQKFIVFKDTYNQATKTLLAIINRKDFQYRRLPYTDYKMMLNCYIKNNDTSYIENFIRIPNIYDSKCRTIPVLEKINKLSPFNEIYSNKNERSLREVVVSDNDGVYMEDIKNIDHLKSILELRIAKIKNPSLEKFDNIRQNASGNTYNIVINNYYS